MAKSAIAVDDLLLLLFGQSSALAAILNFSLRVFVYSFTRLRFSRCYSLVRLESANRLIAHPSQLITPASLERAASRFCRSIADRVLADLHLCRAPAQHSS